MAEHICSITFPFLSFIQQNAISFPVTEMPSRIRSAAASCSLWRPGPGQSEMLSAELFGKAEQSAGLYLDGGALGATDGSKMSLKMRKKPHPNPLEQCPRAGRGAQVQLLNEKSRKEGSSSPNKLGMSPAKPQEHWENWALHTGPTVRKKRENGNVAVLRAGNVPCAGCRDHPQQDPPRDAPASSQHPRTWSFFPGNRSRFLSSAIPPCVALAPLKASGQNPGNSSSLNHSHPSAEEHQRLCRPGQLQAGPGLAPIPEKHSIHPRNSVHTVPAHCKAAPDHALRWSQ